MRVAFPVVLSVWLGLLAGCGSDAASTAVGGSGGAPQASAGRDSGGGSLPGGGTGSAGRSDNPSAGTGNPTAGAGGAAHVTPTVSEWLGSNVSADLSRVDITYQLAGFDTPPEKKDEQGYPRAGESGTSSTDLGFVLPSGTYKLSYKGTGKLTVSGIAALKGTVQTVAGQQRAELQITGSPGDFGRFLTLKIENGAGQSVTDVHLRYPGFDYDSQETFLPELMALLRPFRALRFMDWEATNGSTLVNWSDRPNASHFGHSAFGEPYEHLVELVNETGKDAWVTIPEHANDEFVTQFAQFWAQHLDLTKIEAARAAAGFATPFQLILESSNETWNGGFTAYATFLAAAKADPARYSGNYGGTYGPSWMSGNTDLMKVGQYEADRLVKHSQIFRKELGAHASIVSPVLSGWALGAVYSDVGLRFIADEYGEPKSYIKYVAMAPYFGTDDMHSGSLESLFAGVNADIAAKDATYADFAKLVAEWGIEMAAYEGGQGLDGMTNQGTKHLAQHDRRMYDAYLSYFALWKKHFGAAPFLHFSLAGTPGVPEFVFQYGYWGSIGGVLEDTGKCGLELPTLLGNEALPSVVHYCPKYRALAEQVP